jgi:hypothetical protein
MSITVSAAADVAAATPEKVFNCNCAATKSTRNIFNEAGAADYLHQRPRTLRLWRRHRALPHYKLTSKVVLYSRGDLDQWLEQHRITQRSGL